MLNSKSLRQVLLFGAAGVIGYAVDASFTVLLEPHIGAYAARIPAFLMAATSTWIINRTFTFGASSSRHDNIWKEYGHYLSVMTVGLTVNYITYAIAISILEPRPSNLLICVGIGSLAGMGVNFVLSKRFIFNR